jgi:hypothetical protein
MASYLRSALRWSWTVIPLACAHGVDGDLSLEGDGGGAGSSVVTSGSGGSSAQGGAGPGATVGTGAAGTEVGAGGSAVTAGTGGNAGSTGGTGGTPTSTAGVGGTAGAATSVGGGAGNAGAGGAGGAGGSAGTGGNGGAAGQGGTGGSAGKAGAAGSGGSGVDAGSPLKPTGITLGASTLTTLQAPSTTGNAFDLRCRTGEVLIGYQGTVDPPDVMINYLRTFQGVCGTLSITGTNTYAVHVTQAETLALEGTQTGSMTQMALCPANQVVVGFSGRSGGFIDALSFSCAPLVISGTSPNFMLSIGAFTATSAIGGPGGMPFTAISCPANAVALGETGRADVDIHAFGLVCARPTLLVR